MARKYAYRHRDRHRFRLRGIELQIADADREADHRCSLVGTALLRPDDRTAHAGERRWLLSGPRKESPGCAARSIRVNPVRKTGAGVGTALLRPDERTAQAGVRRWLSGRPKGSPDCSALSIPANPARKDWTKSSTPSTRSGKPARLLSHRNGMRDGLSLGIATTTAASRVARWSGLGFRAS